MPFFGALATQHNTTVREMSDKVNVLKPGKVYVKVFFLKLFVCYNFI